MKLTMFGYVMLIVFVVATVVTSVHLRDVHDAEISAVPHIVGCQSYTIDTVYNFIIGVGEDTMDTDRLRDSTGCVVSQEVVNFVYWEPVIEHSEIK